MKDFLGLSEHQQLKAITANGHFIIDYLQENAVSKVYKLYTFFVKVQYNLPSYTPASVVAYSGTEKIQLFEQKN